MHPIVNSSTVIFCLLKPVIRFMKSILKKNFIQLKLHPVGISSIATFVHIPYTVASNSFNNLSYTVAFNNESNNISCLVVSSKKMTNLILHCIYVYSIHWLPLLIMYVVLGNFLFPSPRCLNSMFLIPNFLRASHFERS